jgi:hypothetical protein
MTRYNDRRVTSHGKQVMLDGAHLADCVSELAANALADALEYIGAKDMPIEARQNIQELLE